VKRRLLPVLGLILAGLVIVVTTGWGALALFYLAPGSEIVRTALAGAFAALGLITLGHRRRVAGAGHDCRRPLPGGHVRLCRPSVGSAHVKAICPPPCGPAARR
jgi:hypothetical protein